MTDWRAGTVAHPMLDELSRHLTVYPGLSHLMTDITVTVCYVDERCMDLV